MGDLINTIKNELTLERVLSVAISTPGVKINREKFLRKELIKYCDEELIDAAIKMNPAKAGVSKKLINRISRQVINYETTKVTGLSVVASVPGGMAAVGAATADITAYFVFILRTVQELAYLYGFEQIDFKDDTIDSETMNYIFIFLGVMLGVQGAENVLKKLANSMANRVSKRLAQKALTKGTIYPITKKAATSVGVRMTKQVFADSVASTIPIIGAALSGGLTFATFRPCCMRLRKNLMSYNLCDPEYYRNEDVMD